MSNYKKQMNMALNEMKKEPWFIELDAKTQKMVIDQTKEFYTPPNNIELTLMNIAIQPLWHEWEDLCKNQFPWADPTDGGADVRLAKRNFVSMNMHRTCFATSSAHLSETPDIAR